MSNFVEAIPYFENVLTTIKEGMLYHQVVSHDMNNRETVLLVKDHVFMIPPNGPAPKIFGIKVVKADVREVSVIFLLFAYGETVAECCINAALTCGRELLADFARQDAIHVLFFTPGFQKCVLVKNRARENFAALRDMLADASWSMEEFNAAKAVVFEKHTLVDLVNL